MSTPRTATSGPALATASPRPVWQLGLTGGGIAAIINTGLFLLYQLITGSPLRASFTTSTSQALTIPQVLLVSIGPGLLAALFAIAVTRWTTEPRRWFAGTGVIIALVSILGPLSQPGAAGNQLVLALMHVVAAITIIRAILPRVPTGQPGAGPKPVPTLLPTSTLVPSEVDAPAGPLEPR